MLDSINLDPELWQILHTAFESEGIGSVVLLILF